ncbi:MAG: helix-turn-helix transcriptional regulator [Verrucomicrobiota bacterium]
MEAITPEQMRIWRQNAEMTQETLGKHLGLKKVAITKIEGGKRKISDPEQKLLRLLMFGELPFHNPVIETKNSTLEFTPEQWEIIHKTAQQEGYTDAKQWIVDKIRSYLRMNPQTSQSQIAAESAAPYNRQDPE